MDREKLVQAFELLFGGKPDDLELTCFADVVSALHTPRSNRPEDYQREEEFRMSLWRSANLLRTIIQQIRARKSSAGSAS